MPICATIFRALSDAADAFRENWKIYRLSFRFLSARIIVSVQQKHAFALAIPMLLFRSLSLISFSNAIGHSPSNPAVDMPRSRWYNGENPKGGKKDGS